MPIEIKAPLVVLGMMLSIMFGVGFFFWFFSKVIKLGD